MMINPLRKPSAHPDIIPIPANIFPSPEIIAPLVMNPLCQEAIFRAHAGDGPSEPSAKGPEYPHRRSGKIKNYGSVSS